MAKFASQAGQLLGSYGIQPDEDTSKTMDELDKLSDKFICVMPH